MSAGVPRRMPEVYQAPFGSRGHRVAVGDDAGVEQRRLGLPAGEPERRHVEQHDVVVGAAGHELRAARQEPLGQRLARCRRSAGRRSGTPAAAPRRAPRPWRPSRGRAGRRAPSGSRGRRRPANSSWASTMPPRGPRSDLCVVVVVTWACGTGSSSPVNTLPATRPAKCAMSTISVAPTSSAISRILAKFTRRGYAE